MSLPALAILLSAGTAWGDIGDPLARVEPLILSLDLAAAEAEIENALHTGTLDRPALARAYAFRGVVEASRRNATAALASYARALRLDPQTRLPRGQAPYVTTPFEATRERLRGRATAFEVTVSQTSASMSPHLRVVVRHDPDGLARRVSASALGATVQAEVVSGTADIDVSMPAGRSVCAQATVRILDAYSNLLAEHSVSDPRCPGLPDAPTVVHDSEVRPVPGYVWLGVVVTGGLIATTALLGGVALDNRATLMNANGDPARAGVRQELHDDAVKAERYAALAGIATGIIAATTLVLYLTRPGRPSTMIRAHFTAVEFMTTF